VTGRQARPTMAAGLEAVDETAHVYAPCRSTYAPTLLAGQDCCPNPQTARRTFPGRRDQVAQARRFVAETLGPVPVLDEVTLLVSEVCTNALLHTASGDDGTFEISVFPREGSVRIEVRDDGSDRIPSPGLPDGSAEAGRGLELVDAIADIWGHFGDQRGRSVFFELGWRAPGPDDGES
jgi:hypothetical protein